jgi:FlaA1/EpsC-like NDP-sugar epimerase
VTRSNVGDPRRNWRNRVSPLADVVAVAGAIYLAFAVRFDEPAPLEQLAAALPFVLVPLFVRPTLNRRFRLYAHSWRHISVPELLNLGLAAVLGTAVMAAAFLVLALLSPPTTAGFPRSFLILEGILSLGAMGAIRFVPRMMADLDMASNHAPLGTPAILYGAGEAGAMMARGATRLASFGLQPVAFLDDDEQKWGKFHAGVRVRGGLASLARTVEETRAELLLITMPTASGEILRAIVEAAAALDLQVRTLPALGDMDEQPNPQMIRPLHLEDLLRRAPVSPQALADLASGLRDQVVLVTGAGGSIGSELARQLLPLEPRRLVLLDRAEGALYELQRDIETIQRQPGQPPMPVEFRIGDVANREAMARLMAAVRPSVIFHAAAYKHVSVMDENPISAVEVNVGGTVAMLDAARDHDVERFVLVSTDKAVEPVGVMGATKRLAELLVAEYSASTGKPWVSVRFGNVLGSSGSVVPIFQRQLARGEPLTITHEDMTRYFMTIPEAVHLILQAANMAAPGELFVLDMGQPVRIVDLARDLLRLQGIRPGRSRIEFTGLRAGERLHERLFHAHEVVLKSDHPKVLRVRTSEARIGLVGPIAGNLLEEARTGASEAVREHLMAAVASAPRPGLRLKGRPRAAVVPPPVFVQTQVAR